MIPAGVTSSMLSDALDAEGCRDQVLDGIRPMHAAARAAGRAATVQFAPCEAVAEDPYHDMIKFIDGLAPGELVIIATAGSRRSAYWGELFSAAALGRGVTGVVTDGCLRDSAGIARLGLPAFASGLRPVDYRGRMRVVAQREPVRCGGVRIEAGDIVLADEDGVVAVPQALEAGALRRSAERAERETTVMEELRGGATLAEVWRRHRIL